MDTSNLLVLGVEDLRKGDVVLIANQAEIFEARLKAHPKQLTPRGQGGRTHTWYGQRKYSTIPCDIREESFTYVRQYNNSSWTTKKPVIAGDKEYNTTKRIDFTGRKVIVVKREEI